MGWKNILSPPPSNLSLEDAIKHVNELLEEARHTKPAKALQLCNEAKLNIKVAEKIFAVKKVGGLALDNGIAHAYHGHAQLLDDLGYDKKAQKSHVKAEKWGYVHIIGPQSSPSQPINIAGSIRQSFCAPAALTVTPSASEAMHQNILGSNITQHAHQDLKQTATPAKIGNRTPVASGNTLQSTQKIFDQNIVPSVKYMLPELGGRFTSTLQLACCLSLLCPSLRSKNGFDENEMKWSQARTNDPDEQKRIQTVATNIIREFVRDELKKPDVIAEVVCLAAVVDQVDFRKLLQAFVNGIEQSTLLDVHLLDGLAQLIANAALGYIESDDLVKILSLLNMRLKGTHPQSTGHIYRLALTVSRVLDSMMDSQVKGLKREQLHKPLFDYLKELQNSSDPSLVYLAAYGHQALLYIPDDESTLQAMLRRTGKVAQGISGVVSAVRALDLNRFIDGLQNIQRGMEDTGDAIKLFGEAYKNANTLAEKGKQLKECLVEGLSFSRKSAWYPTLRGLDAFLQESQLVEFEKLIRKAPCQQDAPFQWGVCQRLGEIAANTQWGTNSRLSAISFLGEIYNDDTKWILQADVKDWIICVLSRLADSSDAMVAGSARALVQRLEVNSGLKKKVLFKVGLNVHQGPCVLMITPLPELSPLLDLVQNKPDVETALRQLKLRRLEERSRDDYISPRAKAHIKAIDDFDLTSNVQAFLGSHKKVFLILGDSGAGKSTFNRALESTLWEKYEKDGRIPLFVHLPTIDKPEQNLITKHLHTIGFSEDQIRELKTHREFILICDGYDEIQQTTNLYMSNQLNQTVGWRAQMVISCRIEYNGVDYKNCFQPMDRNYGRQPELFQEAVIMPFNTDQIRDYIDQYVLVNTSPWKSEDYKRAFAEIRNLQGLVKNPFLLKLALEVLPTTVDMQKDISSTQITRVELYDKFVVQWIERSEIRFREMNLNSHVQEAFKGLSDAGFKQSSISYLKELSTAIYTNQGGNPVVRYSERLDQKTWKEPLFNKRHELKLIREAIPLMRNGDQYRFIHKSVLEYAFTLTIFDPNVNEAYSEPTPTLTRRGSTSSALSFETSSTVEKAANLIDTSLQSSSLGVRNFVSEPSILHFLVERVQLHPVFKDQLHVIIQLSKTDRTVRTAAANAITVLVQAGATFIGADLCGIKIPGADLSYGMFDSAQLEGSDLRKVNLQTVWLREANLDGAWMAGVKFGELPFLQEYDSILSCAFSPDGKTFVVGLSTGEIGIYETSDWRRIRGITGHSKKINSVAYSPRGDQIASGSDDETVRLWDVKSGNCTQILKGHRECVSTVEYSPKGSWIASGSWDRTVRLWDVETGDCVQNFEGHRGLVTSAAYSQNGGQVASGSTDATVRLWNVETGTWVQTLQGHTSGINSIIYSPRGDRIASGSDDKTLRLWDVETGDCVITLHGHTDKIRSVAYSPKGDQVASGGNDSTVRLWDIETCICINTLQGQSAGVTSVAYSTKGDQIASGSWDRTVRLRYVGESNYVRALQCHGGTVHDVMYSPKGGQIVSGSEDITLRLWDVETGICTHTLEGHSAKVYSVVYSPNGNYIASGSWDKTVRLWDVDTGNCIYTLRGHRSVVREVVFSPKGDLVASGSWDNTVRLWDVDTGDCTYILQGHDKEVTMITFSPKGDQIASGSWDKTVRLWDAETGNCIHTLEGHNERVSCVMYSPKGDQIASGSKDKTVRLWDVETGDCTYTLQGHSEEVNMVAYSPKGDQIASCSSDNTLRLWDVEAGTCARTLEGHTETVVSFLYSAENQIASGSWDRTVRLWNTETGECLLEISGFNGTVGCIDFYDQYLVTGSWDRSVRHWQIIKEHDKYKALLCWSSSHDMLTASGASFNGVQGLRKVDLELLRQCGASILPLSPKQDT